MPFDFAPSETTVAPSVADVLRRARTLLADPAVWAKGWGMKFPKKGLCIMSALNAALDDDSYDYLIFTDAHDVLYGILGGAPAIWQDRHERTHAEVIALLDSGIAAAERAP